MDSLEVAGFENMQKTGGKDLEWRQDASRWRRPGNCWKGSTNKPLLARWKMSAMYFLMPQCLGFIVALLGFLYIKWFETGGLSQVLLPCSLVCRPTRGSSNFTKHTRVTPALALPPLVLRQFQQQCNLYMLRKFSSRQWPAESSMTLSVVNQHLNTKIRRLFEGKLAETAVSQNAHYEATISRHFKSQSKRASGQ